METRLGFSQETGVSTPTLPLTSGALVPSMFVFLVRQVRGRQVSWGLLGLWQPEAGAHLHAHCLGVQLFTGALWRNKEKLVGRLLRPRPGLRHEDGGSGRPGALAGGRLRPLGRWRGGKARGGPFCAGLQGCRHGPRTQIS